MHRGEERIFIESPYQQEINTILRRQAGIRYSKTYKQWHLPLQEKAYRMLVEALSNIAVVNRAALSHYLKKKSVNTPDDLPLSTAVKTNPATRLPALQTAGLLAEPPIERTKTVAIATTTDQISKITQVNAHIGTKFILTYNADGTLSELKQNEPFNKKLVFSYE